MNTHYGKVDQSIDLANNHGFDDIKDLLTKLNDGRKANAYGDDEFDESEYDAKDIASKIESYFNGTENFV